MYNIMFFIPNLSAGGAERVVSILSSELVKCGHKVSIILLNNNKRAYDIEPHVKIINLEEKTKNIPDILKKMGYLLVLHKLFRHEAGAVIIPFQSTCLKYAITARFNTRVKVIACERNDPHSMYRDGDIAKKIRKLFQKADYSVFQTCMAREYYDNIPDDKCSIILNPVTEPLTFWKKKIKSHRIVTICRLNPQKNLTMAIDAASILRDRIGENFSYEIYGQGEEKNKLLEYVSQKKLDNVVHLCGTTNKVNEVLTEASVFVLPSNYEGISNSMLEALAVGVPTICTDCPAGGARQVIENGKNGVLIAVNDTISLANEIEKLFLNESSAKKMGFEAQISMKKLNVQAIVKEWINVVEKIGEQDEKFKSIY